MPQKKEAPIVLASQQKHRHKDRHSERSEESQHILMQRYAQPLPATNSNQLRKVKLIRTKLVILSETKWSRRTCILILHYNASGSRGTYCGTSTTPPLALSYFKRTML